MKRTVFAGLTAMLILSTAVTAQATHTHEYAKQNSKVYVCECGKEKPLYSLKGERAITLNCNGGSLYGGIYKTDITEAVTEQNKIKLPLPYKSSDYQFEGWFTESGEKVSSDTDNTLAAKYGQTAGKITFDGLSGKHAAGDKICLVLIYANGARTYISDVTDVIKPVGADSVTIVEESFDAASEKATVIVRGCEDYLGIYSTLFLTVGTEREIDDADSRHKIAQTKFVGEGTYELAFDSKLLSAGQNIQAHIYLYDGDTDRSYYKYGTPVLIEEAGDTPEKEPTVAIEGEIRADSEKITATKHAEPLR